MKTYQNYQLVLMFILTGYLLIFSNQSYSQIHRLKFDHLGVRDGLSDATVTCVLQDQNGFMWFGTYRGVSRFNGYEFTSFLFNENEPNALHNNVISCMLEDYTGKIWIGSYKFGIGVFDPHLESFTHVQGGRADSLMLANNSINTLFEDSENNLWVGTEHGLSMISADRKSFKKFYESDTSKNTLNDETIYDIAEGPMGRIWIATGHSNLCYYDKQTGQFTQVDYTDVSLNNGSDNYQKKIYFQDSLLWVTSNKGGLSKLNIISNNKKSYLPDFSNRGPSAWKIMDMLAFEGKLWLGTDGGGLDIFDPETEIFTNYKNTRNDQSSLTSNVLWSLCRDRQDNIWIGTYQGGISKYDALSNFFHLTENEPSNPNSLSGKPIISLCARPEGGLWIGTDWGGLQLIKPDGTFDQFVWQQHQNSLSTNVVKSLCYDRNGNLLIGTYNHGLSSYDTKTGQFKHFSSGNELNSLSHNNIWSMYTDSRGITWLGTLGAGIATYNPDKESFSRPDVGYREGGQLLVFQIFEDSQSNLWFSTDSGVIFYNRRTERWEPFLLSDRIENSNHEMNYVKSVIEDKSHHIWFATSAGLIKYMPENETYELIDQLRDQLDLPVLDMAEDDYGNLILIAKTNILQFDLLKEKATNYYISDNSFTTGALLKKPSGEIILGGFNGLTTFHPKDLRKNDFEPSVFLTEFHVFNESQKPLHNNSPLDTVITFDKELNIDFQQSVINFKYTALNYTQPERNQFAYKLEGFDQDWNYVGNRRIATYTNLNPGTYTFKVKASNNHGVWNEEGKSIELNVRPPFWKTTWFSFLSTLLILMSLYSVYRMRITQVKRRFENRTLKNEREMIGLKNANLKEQLNATKSELTNITMNYLHKNQKLQQIRQKIEDSVTDANQALKGKMNRIVKEIDKEIQDHEYWDKFEHQFNKSHDNFLGRFKQTYPDLSKRELRICAYLRMGLDNHEISTLMNVAVRTVETSRYRIRKKIDLEERQSFTKMILRF
ncbi:two-component regulator propeller domain-containing protein [Reichenbachiella sp.]|uniref:ligand-binding sensor domain-containing protein n=1 Tax=Reichenbachiella sp. TaxID=2184521 RepID=UPI003297A8A2